MLFPVTLSELAKYHPDAMEIFEATRVAYGSRFARKTLIDFEFFYNRPDQPKSKWGLKVKPTSPVKKDGTIDDFMKFANDNPTGQTVENKVECGEYHQENEGSVIRDSAVCTIVMIERGYPGTQVVIDSYPLLVDPNLTRKMVNEGRM